LQKAAFAQQEYFTESAFFDDERARLDIGGDILFCVTTAAPQ
jgi:hypothetical protein